MRRGAQAFRPSPELAAKLARLWVFVRWPSIIQPSVSLSRISLQRLQGLQKGRVQDRGFNDNELRDWRGRWTKEGEAADYLSAGNTGEVLRDSLNQNQNTWSVGGTAVSRLGVEASAPQSASHVAYGPLDRPSAGPSENDVSASPPDLVESFLSGLNQPIYDFLESALRPFSATTLGGPFYRFVQDAQAYTRQQIALAATQKGDVAAVAVGNAVRTILLLVLLRQAAVATGGALRATSSVSAIQGVADILEGTGSLGAEKTHDILMNVLTGRLTGADWDDAVLGAVLGQRFGPGSTLPRSMGKDWELPDRPSTTSSDPASEKPKADAQVPKEDAPAPKALPLQTTVGKTEIPAPPDFETIGREGAPLSENPAENAANNRAVRAIYEAAKTATDPEALGRVEVRNAKGERVPVSAFASKDVQKYLMWTQEAVGHPEPTQFTIADLEVFKDIAEANIPKVGMEKADALKSPDNKYSRFLFLGELGGKSSPESLGLTPKDFMRTPEPVLTEHIKQAMALSSAYRKLAEEYTGNGFRRVNPDLMNAEPASKSLLTAEAIAQAALEVETGTKTMRKVYLPDSDIRALLEGHWNSHILQQPHLTSTSIDPHAWREPGNNVPIVTITSPGMKAAYLEPISRNRHEKELVFMNNSTYILAGMEPVYGAGKTEIERGADWVVYLIALPEAGQKGSKR